MELTVLKETDDSYVVMDGGTKKVLHKIDQEDIKRQHAKSVEKVAGALSLTDIKVVMNMTEYILNNDFAVIEKYNDSANISPEIYGKGHTLRKECMSLFDFMEEVLHKMKELGRIEDFKTSKDVVLKLDIYVDKSEMRTKLNEELHALIYSILNKYGIIVKRSTSGDKITYSSEIS